MKSGNKLEGASNFRAWKLRIDLILAKNNVLDIVTGKVVEPTNAPGKEKFKEDDITVMGLFVDSIKDHLIPYMAKHDISKKMYDVLEIKLRGGVNQY